MQMAEYRNYFGDRLYQNGIHGARQTFVNLGIVLSYLWLQVAIEKAKCLGLLKKQLKCMQVYPECPSLLVEETEIVSTL